MKYLIFLFVFLPLFQTAAAQAPAEGAAGTDGVVLSRGETLALTRADYADFIAGYGLTPEQRRELLTDNRKLLAFVVNYHTRRALVRQAESMRLDATPHFKRALAAARERLLVKAFMKRRTIKKAGLGKLLREARKKYAAYPDAFAIPERRKAAHILIGNRVLRGEACDCEPPITVVNLQMRLEAGLSFGELARRFSEDEETAGQEGLIDHWVTRDDGYENPSLRPLHQALFALEYQGEISPPVRTDYGTHLVQWVDTEPRRIPKFREVRVPLVSLLRAEQVRLKQIRLYEEASPDTDSLRLDEIRALLESPGPSPEAE